MGTWCEGFADGRPWRRYDVLGRQVRVFDDFETAMLMNEMMEDPLFEPHEKDELALRMVTPDPARFAEAFGGRARDALAEVLRQAFGYGEDGQGEGERAMDLDEDAARIRATMLAAYGLREAEWRAMPFRDVCDLLALAPRETPMGQAVYYRTAKRPKATKGNKEALRAFDEARRFYRLGESKAPEKANDRATGAFEALRRRAEQNG